MVTKIAYFKIRCTVLSLTFSSHFLGIASPNKRPTLFDVFRRKDSKKEKDGSKSSSDKDSVGSSGSGGIMNSMKAAIYKSAEAPEIKSKKAVKDGSAHPHAGSDARVSISQIAEAHTFIY
jgi:hypothetical protein